MKPPGKKNCGVASREKEQQRNNSFALFQHCGLSPLSSQQMKYKKAPPSPKLPYDSLLSMRTPPPKKKPRRLTEDTSVRHL